MTGTPLTDWVEEHLTADLCRHMTQTFWDAAPRETTFEMAWTLEPGGRGRLRVAAENYCKIAARRPLNDSEVTLATDSKVPGFPAGTKISGFDAGHFVMSILSAIVRCLGPHDSTAKRAYSLLVAQVDAYLYAPNSWLNLASKSYGTTGRMRIAGMCIRALCDLMEAAYSMGENDRGERCRVLIERHIVNVAMQNMNDDAQGDGLTIPHWRGFQVAIGMAALERAKRVMKFDTTPLVDRFLPVIAAHVRQDTSGIAIGFWYDVPEPLGVPGPWPGEKPTDGNGVELWMYTYMPNDARDLIELRNPHLPYAVRAKFGMADE